MGGNNDVCEYFQGHNEHVIYADAHVAAERSGMTIAVPAMAMPCAATAEGSYSSTKSRQATSSPSPPLTSILSGKLHTLGIIIPKSFVL